MSKHFSHNISGFYVTFQSGNMKVGQTPPPNKCPRTAPSQDHRCPSRQDASLGQTLPLASEKRPVFDVGLTETTSKSVSKVLRAFAFQKCDS